MNPSPQITEEDVQRALRKFLKQGGVIRRLPPTKPLERSLVGSRHGQYEHPLDLLGLSGISRG